MLDTIILFSTTIAYIALYKQREIYFQFIFAISFILNWRTFYDANIKNIHLLLFKVTFIYLFAYFLIKDPNPFYHLLFFFLPFQNYFRGIFILLFTSILLSNKKNINKSEKESKQIQEKSYFCKAIVQNLVKSKTIFLLIIAFLSLIHFFQYMYEQRWFIYFESKNSLLNSYSKGEQKYFIAANLYDNEKILPNWITQMKLLINYLGTSKVYVSILENGDSRDKTAIYLNEFREYLNSINVSNLIITNKTFSKEGKKRFEFMAILRNAAINYLYQIPNLKFNETTILFFNDIIFKYQDIIKLLGTNNGDYDAVCGMDFYESFYDTAVGIGIDGEKFRHYFPFFLNKVAQDLFINGENIRIFSCWNGVIAYKAVPFENRMVWFRAFNERKVSECTILNIFIQADGYRKFIVNPNLIFTYEYEYYYKNRFIYPWTKNLFTYFYYYFVSFFEKKNYVMADTKSDWIDYDFNFV